MSLRTAIASELKADVTISGLVGTRVGMGGYASPKWDLPYITFQVISGEHARHMTGGSKLAVKTVQVNLYETDPEKAETLAEAARELLDNFRGTMGNGANTVSVRCCKLGPEIDDVEAGSPGAHTRIYSVRQTYTIWYNETET